MQISAKNSINSYLAERIYILRSQDAKGRDAHYVLLLEPSKRDIFLKRIKQDGDVDLRKYGEIVASGYGDELTVETKNMLKNKYNITLDNQD